MAKIFDEVLQAGLRAGQLPGKEKTAREWYRATAKSYRKIDERTLMTSDTDRLNTRIRVGNMYMFYYDPKHKDTLPYYDRFPLIFPYKKVKGGFMGLNLHYLPLDLRAKLMDALYEVTSNKRYNENTKLKINYSILESSSKFRFFKPCVKHYLSDHVRSKFLHVNASEWDIALFLPTQRFVGATKTEVWEDSRKIIRGG